MVSIERRLIVERRPGEARAILLEDGFPVELRVERDTDGSLVGAIFWGRIVRVVPSLPGSFVELGLDRPAFLPGDKLPGGVAPVEGAPPKLPNIVILLMLIGIIAAKSWGWNGSLRSR